MGVTCSTARNCRRIFPPRKEGQSAIQGGRRVYGGEDPRRKTMQSTLTSGVFYSSKCDCRVSAHVNNDLFNILNELEKIYRSNFSRTNASKCGHVSLDIIDVSRNSLTTTPPALLGCHDHQLATCSQLLIPS